MNKNIEEKFLLYLYSEMTAEEQHEIENKINTSKEYRDEYERLKKFHSFITTQTQAEVSEKVLNDARRQLRVTLAEERSKKSLSVIITSTIDRIRNLVSPQFAYALGTVAALAIGIFIGSTFSRSSHVASQSALQSESAEQSRIANVQIIENGTANGEVELSYESVTPVRVRGNVNDAQIQKILAYTLLNENNPGVRLRTVSTMETQLETKHATEPAIKSALIQALKKDDNPGVRREALRVLQQFSFDTEIQDAVLYTLLHDTNSGIRVVAINVLANAKLNGASFDANVKQTLKHIQEKEKNNYVRIRTASFIQENIL